MSDNGPCFVSGEFQEFLKWNCITHKLSAPYHQALNELAERAVQTIKRGARRQTKGQPLEAHLAELLLHYRMTPQITTGVAPDVSG